MEQIAATTDSSNGEEQSVFDVRRLARKRAWICPGAGFAVLGRFKAGAITYLAGLLTIVAATVAVFLTSKATLGATAGLIVVGTLLWFYELWATYTAWPTKGEVPVDETAGNESAGDGGRSGFIAATIAMWVAFALFCAAMLLTFRILQVGGMGMMPTLYEGDRVLFRRFVDVKRLDRNAVVVFRLHSENKFTTPGTMMVGRIMAVPGDRLTIDGDTYYVNDVVAQHVAPSEPYPVALDVPRRPKQIVVPPDSYFIFQDAPERGLDSRVLWWARLNDIDSNFVYRFGGPSWCERLE